MSNNKKWRVWLDKDGHITSHRPYLDTSPVRWLGVSEDPDLKNFDYFLKTLDVKPEPWQEEVMRRILSGDRIFRGRRGGWSHIGMWLEKYEAGLK